MSNSDITPRRQILSLFVRRILVTTYLTLAAPLLNATVGHANFADDVTTQRFRAFALDPIWRSLFSSLPRVDVEPNGRVGANRNTFRYPELQCVGAEFVIRGLLNGREDWRSQGWRILDAGFQDMREDGQLIGLENDLIHSSAFFLYGVGEALLVDPKEATNDRVARFMKAVEHLAQDRQLNEGRAMARRFTHRAFMWSFMFRSASLFQASTRYEGLAEEFMKTGLAAQTYDGIFPEMGGFDALYMSIGLDLLIKLSALSTGQNESAQMWAATRGLAVLIARIEMNGRLIVSGSTRVGKELNRYGETKRLSQWQIAQPFYGAWIFLKDPLFLEAARRAMKCNLSCQTGEP